MPPPCNHRYRTEVVQHTLIEKDGKNVIVATCLCFCCGKEPIVVSYREYHQQAGRDHNLYPPKQYGRLTARQLESLERG